MSVMVTPPTVMLSSTAVVPAGERCQTSRAVTRALPGTPNVVGSKVLVVPPPPSVQFMTVLVSPAPSPVRS
jgi:hypothetical protein